MATNLKTYDPSQVVIILEKGGQSHIIVGVSEGTIVTVDRAGDAFSESVGAYGDTTRIYNPIWDKANITIPLQQTSESNDVLNALFQTDVAARNSDNLFSITIKDTEGRSLHYGYEAYVAVKPNAAYGNTMNNREWVVRVNRLEDTIGGNSKVDAQLAATVADFGGSIDSKWIN